MRKIGYIQRIGIAVTVIVLCTFILNLQSNQATAFSGQIVQKGSTGDDVIELQARLQYISYYKGKIDGVFGWGTYWALRNFQQKYGLKVDGQLGTMTRQKLVKASKYDESFVKRNINAGNAFTYYGGVPLDQQVKKRAANNSSGNNKNQSSNQNQSTGQKGNQGGKYTIDHLPSGYSKSDINLMSNAVYGESRGEPYVGQVAVAAVIVNRVSNSKFPNNVSGVIFQPGAFTAVADGQIWLTPNETAKRAVLDALNGWDPTHGAIYYFNPETATSAWIWSRPQIAKIGRHIFCE
ncbi:spore cortex-lytic enzyme [Terrilactibacillus sp. BCM23-1]|uniref:Spore cortex-lytic enzyme n=1 Tax=Terrilactibacillus tamarindi TaxID=2599694 RepID=A0A6N8CQN5_9BACI|nr:spore cortex-lytic enzyme [Terrilactibacillus tamarindi]MTT31255.1 spore cortex-lytic enzyme [Terrilactibacillus tamarindi]